MQIVYSRCCGLDVHKKVIVGCVLLIGEDGTRHREVRSFGTMTRDLLQMLDWLQAAGCTHVAMESTGVYWKPVYNLLEAHVTVLLVNPQHIKAVPGRKTDVKDAEWIADLLAHGLLSPSFIPPAPQRELRELTRARTTLVQERARVINRIQKVLEDTNVKLASVVSNIMGVSARDMLAQLLDGHNDPEQVANLARGRLRSKREQLQEALVGVFQPHHRFLLSGHLTHVDFLDEQVEQLDQEIARRLDPPPSQPPTTQSSCHPLSPASDERAAQAPEGEESCDPLSKLEQVPGIGRRVAEIIVAEVGTDMSRFPSDKHLASWVGLCPANKQSAGKRLSGRTGRGNTWLRSALVEAAHGAARSKGTFLGEQYQRLSRRLGRKKALIAVAHSILVIVYHLLKEQTAQYHELGTQFVQAREREQATQRAVKRLEGLGYKVQLEPVDAAA